MAFTDAPAAELLAAEAAADAAPTPTARPTRSATFTRYPMIVLFLLALLDAADRGLLATVFPLIDAEFRVSDSALGALASAYTVVGTAALIPFGILVDRVRRTSVAAAGVVIWSWCMIAVGSAGSFAALVLTRSLLGVAEASRQPAGFSLLSDYYPVAVRTRRMALMQVGSYAGGIVLPIAAFVAEQWGWRAAFYLLAVPGFILGVIVWWLVEPERGLQDSAHHQVQEAALTSELGRLSALQAFRRILGIPTMLVTMLGQAVLVLATSGAAIWLTTFAVRYHDMSITTATIALSLVAVGLITGGLIGGSLGDRVTREKGSRARMRVIGTAMLLGGTFLTLSFAIPNTLLFYIFLPIGCVFVAIALPMQASVWADVLHPDLRGRGVAVTGLVGIIGGAISPLLIGVLSDALGLRGAFLLTIPLLIVAGAVVLVSGPRHIEHDQQKMLAQLRGAAT